MKNQQTQNPKDLIKDRAISDPKVDQDDKTTQPKPILDKPEKVVPQEVKNATVEDSKVPPENTKNPGEKQNLNIAP